MQFLTEQCMAMQKWLRLVQPHKMAAANNDIIVTHVNSPRYTVLELLGAQEGPAPSYEACPLRF